MKTTKNEKETYLSLVDLLSLVWAFCFVLFGSASGLTCVARVPCFGSGTCGVVSDKTCVTRASCLTRVTRGSGLTRVVRVSGLTLVTLFQV